MMAPPPPLPPIDWIMALQVLGIILMGAGAFALVGLVIWAELARRAAWRKFYDTPPSDLQIHIVRDEWHR